ncbi:MAG: exodeoxyribonuclease III [Candidatus Paceibacterota bacterium]
MPKNLKLISWNVNGIRAAWRHGFLDYLDNGYDLVAVQETKVHDPDILPTELKNPAGYHTYWHSGEKKGYSGVAVFSKIKPRRVKTNFGRQSLLSQEGRVIELEFADFVFLNIYFPNGGSSEERLNYKLEFYRQFFTYIKKLDRAGKKIIFTGDLNTAHHEIDIARPKENINNSGFMPKERIWLDKFAQAGFIDTFRDLAPKKVKYSYWDMKTRARDRNVGWRIDYFYVNRRMRDRVVRANIQDEVLGSDHAPVYLSIN